MKQYDGHVTVVRGEHTDDFVRAHLQGDELGWNGVLERFAQGSPPFQVGDDVVLRFEEGGEGNATVTHAEYDKQEIRPQGYKFPVDIIFTPRRVLIRGQGPVPFG